MRQQEGVGRGQRRRFLIPGHRRARVVHLKRQVADVRGVCRLIMVVVHEHGIPHERLARVVEVAKLLRDRGELGQHRWIGRKFFARQLESALRFGVLPVQRERPAVKTKNLTAGR